MLSRSNPFLSAILGNTQLKFIDFDGEELVVGISNNVAESVMPFFEDIINTQALKVIKKKIVEGPKIIKLIDSDNNITLIEVAPRPEKIKP